jgi:hypothetical protein
VQFGDGGYLRLSAAASVDAAATPDRIYFAFDLVGLYKCVLWNYKTFRSATRCSMETDKLRL